ncbi:5-formyltetrahydrofolate cyclo-ligase [Croceibacterium mercuriale]|uniref:5-formyltetrahydrofolate cyclo-ligase n=1 Tax=Croceibacterium mercuriale TaxID=1572751 RepID=A0A0B2BX10_9SPHN|nr:5-formyltetrahydrofolate cyclo-ligase [Croceibacterium mercuriale]KHL25974.1 5-formyltetrahydrofolate cyclo-ligase [Croceibacterium mercuriale]
MADIFEQKTTLRAALRQTRLGHAAALPPEVSALVFNRPPRPVLDLVPEGATIGLYRAAEGEARTAGYIRFFFEAGHPVALPRVAGGRTMTFHRHTDPYEESDLAPGPLGLLQPAAQAPVAEPEVLFVPLVGFTPSGERLGQGGGFYDRYLLDHPDVIAIGMAWDVQEVAELPLATHDMPLTAIVTPTRVLGPF